MALWLLRPVYDWSPWYDSAFGFVVRAETEEDARRMVSEAKYCGAERWGLYPGDEGGDVWADAEQTTCERIDPDGDPAILMRDFAAA